MEEFNISNEIVVSALENKSVYSDSLSKHFLRGTYFGVGGLSGFSTAGYVALNTAGLGIIRSKHTRNEIVDYFDNELSELRMRTEPFLTKLNIYDEYFTRNFYRTFNGGLVPIDYARIIEDRFCYSLYIKLLTERKVLMIFISRSLEQAEQVLQLIKNELASS